MLNSENWKRISLNPEDTLSKAITVLDEGGMRIALVVGKSGKLLGTITDGDVRRALLRHLGMDALVTEVMQQNPTTALETDDYKKLLTLMKSKDLLHMPILDTDGCMVSLKTLQQFLNNEKLDNPIFLMAGGFGKRLSPLTNEIPKPLLKVGSKPILETILTQFIDYGFYNFFISTHYKAEMVRKHFGDGSQWGVNIRYVHEDKPLGTAGAIGLLPDDLPRLPIIMMNGDLLTKINFTDLLRFHNEQNGVATMCVREYDFQVPYGVIESDGLEIKDIVEKPIHNFFVNAGIYVLSPQLARQVDGYNYLDMPRLIQEKIKDGEIVNMFPVHEYWLDIGQMEEFDQAKRDSDEFFS